MEGIILVKDFAIIMVVAGAITLVFRRLRQPVILGYLIAGVLIGPYTLPTPPVTDVHTINLLADLGLVLLLFGIGLEFSWNKIRQFGLQVLVIGAVEIVTMISIGYGLGQAFGWSTTDSIFLGAALHISSSAIIVKILRDSGKLNRLSSRIIVGILVVEDFAAITIIAVLSGMATTGTTDIGDIGSLILRLVIFVVSSLVIGAVFVPRLIRFTHRFNSREALLVTSLGLCFALALLGEYLGLSISIGAFLMGSLIGDTENSEEVIETIGPVRDMFAAIFFVTIGMLIDIRDIGQFILPAAIVSVVFIAGKVIANTVATFLAGNSGKTALEVGMGMPQVGEFSLVIVRVGTQGGIVLPQLYPVIALATALTSFTTPYISRSTDSAIQALDRLCPELLKTYISRLSDWLTALRSSFSRDSITALVIQHAVKLILINLIIILVLVSFATFSLRYVERLASFIGIPSHIVGLIFGCVLIVLCLPSLSAIWRNLRSLVSEATAHLLRRRLSAKKWGHEALRTVLRDSIVIGLTVLMALWFIPFFSGLFSLGSSALAVPIILLGLAVYLVLRYSFDIHGQLERTFSRTLMGTEYVSASPTARMAKTIRKRLARLSRRFKPAAKEERSKK